MSGDWGRSSVTFTPCLLPPLEINSPLAARSTAPPKNNTGGAHMDFSLTAEQKELQAIARKFARERIAPRAREADREPDPAKAWPADLFREASKLGLRTFKLPRQ